MITLCNTKIGIMNRALGLTVYVCECMVLKCTKPIDGASYAICYYRNVTYSHFARAYTMHKQNTAAKCQSPMHAWGIMAIWASDRIAESTLSYLGFGGESCFWCGVYSLSSLYHTLSHILRNGIASYLVNEMNSMPKCWTCLSMWLFVCLCVSECWRWTKPNGEPLFGIVLSQRN